MKNQNLFNHHLEKIICQNQKVDITFQSSDGKINQIQGFVKDLFEKNDQWWVVLETGLPIPLQEIKSIVLSSR